MTLLVELAIAIIVGIGLCGISDILIRYKTKGLMHSTSALKTKAKVVAITLQALGYLCIRLITTNSYHLTELLILLAFAIVIGLVDSAIKVIPNEIVALLFVVGITRHILLGSFINGLIGLGVGCGIILLPAFVLGIDKIGFGDIKLMGVIGLISGYPNILVVILVMSTALIIYSAIAIFAKQITLKSKLPFGGFMMTGLMITVWFSYSLA